MDRVERGADESSAGAETVEVGNGVVDAMVDDGPKRESDRLVSMSPKDEPKESDVDSNGVLSGAGNVSCLVIVAFVN